MVWTDDDVLVDSASLGAYCEAFQQWPEVTIFGGPIVPWFEGSTPEWLQEGFRVIEGAYAARDFGSEPVPLGHDTYPFGPNMAIRTRRSGVSRMMPDLVFGLAAWFEGKKCT